MIRTARQFVSAQVRETVRRPWRLFLGPFFRCILALLRRPQLVRITLSALPQRLMKKAGRESLYVAAGYELFQREWPEEAWLCLECYLRIGQPSIEEYLLGANCLYHGLGRFRDAMALLAAANERGLREAERFGLSNSPFRVLDSVRARHIGHIAELGYVVMLGILEGRARDNTILYVPRGSPVANRFLLQQVAEYLRLIEDPTDLPFNASAVQALHYNLRAPLLPDKKTAYFWTVAGETCKRWHQEGRGPLLALPPHVAARGWAALRKLGMPQGSWFVALHVREGTWDSKAPGLHGIRNADISTYFGAISEIARRGGWVVRVGDPGMRPLPPFPNVIDYCHSEVRADWMDIFILACCRFMIGTNSGPAFVPGLYGVPCVLTNWWPPAERPWQPSDIFVTKLLRRVSDGRHLTMAEFLREPFSYCLSRRYLADHEGVLVEDNEPELIRGAVVEMLERFEDGASTDQRLEEQRLRAERIYQSHEVVGMAAPAREFVHRYGALIT